MKCNRSQFGCGGPSKVPVRSIPTQEERRLRPARKSQTGPAGQEANLKVANLIAPVHGDLKRLQRKTKQKYFFQILLNSSVTRPITSPQLPNCFCRNNRIVGYHGLLSRSSIHRQSAFTRNKVQTGTPVSQTQAAGFRQRREGLAYRLTWQKKGVKPRKRVAPDAKTPTRHRKIIYRTRYYISAWSNRVFKFARQLQKPQIYYRWARVAAAVYHGLAYHQGKFKEMFKRHSELKG